MCSFKTSSIVFGGAGGTGVVRSTTGNSLISLFISDFPSQTQSVSPLGPFTVTSTTTKIDTRARGRLLSVKIENESVGETWRYGSLRLDAQPDGRR